jgi:hypothetical protein
LNTVIKYPYPDFLKQWGDVLASNIGHSSNIPQNSNIEFNQNVINHTNKTNVLRNGNNIMTMNDEYEQDPKPGIKRPHSSDDYSNTGLFHNMSLLSLLLC